jgi:hypothetical protein
MGEILCCCCKKKSFKSREYVSIDTDENENENQKFTYRDSFNFIPQIEIKFNEVTDIKKELIDDLLSQLFLLFQGKDVKIVEMKKGSLDIAISLNYLIKEGLGSLDIQNITIDELFKTLGESLNIETKKAKNMIQENLIIAQQDKKFKPDFVNENLLDLTQEDSKDKLCKMIKDQYEKENNEIDILEFSKNITPDDIKKFFNKLCKETKNQQDLLYDIILNNNFQEYLQFFEEEFEKAKKNSIFEYNTKFIAYIYRDDETYRSKKLRCNNLEKKIVFHGTKSWCISRILAGKFRKANVHIFGEGVYFTDLLDYAWYYASESEEDQRANFCKIPKIKDSFSFIASEVYYDKTKFEQVYDTYKCNESVPVNGIRYILVNYYSAAIPQYQLTSFKGFMGTEYLITEEDQILPLLNVTVERAEYLIVWRDNNFLPSNPNNYSNFEEMIDFNLRIKKYSAFNLKTKIYFFNESNEALNFIKRKKYNKIILISNGGNDGIGFINNARKIIGSNTISLIACYNVEYYMYIVQNNEKILINSKYFECIKEFLKCSTNENINDLKNLQKDIETKLKEIDQSFSFKPINNQAFSFPYFKDDGNFSEVLFD